MGLIIAVVDDHESMRKAIIKGLRRSGLDIEQICEAKNGEEALAEFSHFNIDLAILDIHMPGMNGLQLIEQLKNSPFWSRIPCVFISGEEDQNKVAFAAQKGIGFIQKPFSQTTLAETIVNMLSEAFIEEKQT